MEKVDFLNKIERIICAARTALENESVKKSLTGLNWFPKGACYDASLLLASVLSRSGYTEFRIVCGTRKKSNHIDDQTHSWLENDSYIIDITPDQFGYPAKYIFAPKSDVEEKHLGFEKVSKSMPELGFTGVALGSFAIAFKKALQDSGTIH